MPIPSYGLEEVCFIAQEKTYGTLADGTAPGGVWRAFRAISFRLISEDPPTKRRSPTGRTVGWLYSAGANPGPREIKLLPKVRGEVVLECDWEDIGALLKVALNKDPTYSFASPVLTSTFDVASVPAAMVQSLSIVRKVGATFSSKDQQFLGCYIENFRLRFEPDQPVLAYVTFVGRRMTFGAAPTATFSGTPWMEYHEHDVLTTFTMDGIKPSVSLSGGNEATITEVSIANPLRAIGGSGQGTRGMRKPIFNGDRTFAIRLERDWTESTFLDAYYAEGAGGYCQAVVKAVSEDSIPTSVTKYSLEFWFPAARVVGIPPAYEGGQEIVPQVITLEAAYDAQNAKFVQATLINGGVNNEYQDDV